MLLATLAQSGTAQQTGVEHVDFPTSGTTAAQAEFREGVAATHNFWYTEARRRFTEADLVAQTKGIECPKDESRIDEIPSAYKDIEKVMQNQNDLVEVVATLHQVLNVKG